MEFDEKAYLKNKRLHYLHEGKIVNKSHETRLQ